MYDVRFRGWWWRFSYIDMQRQWDTSNKPMHTLTYKYTRVNTGISWQMNMESKHSQSRGECFISNQLPVTCCGHIYVLLISSSVSEYLTLNILDHVVSISWRVEETHCTVLRNDFFDNRFCENFNIFLVFRVYQGDLIHFKITRKAGKKSTKKNDKQRIT